MNRTAHRAARFVAGGALALAAMAALPTTARAYVEEDPVLMCDETETLIVCCAVDAGQIKSCRMIPK